MTRMYQKIFRRSGHISVYYKGHMLVWAGYIEIIEHSDNRYLRRTEYHLTDELWIYHTSTEVWKRVLTKGDIPPTNSGACGLILHNDFYVFGGYHEFNEYRYGDTNDIYRLNLKSMVWEKLEPLGIKPNPCDKHTGWVYKEKLYFLCGFGPAPESNVPFSFILDESLRNEPRGWLNQFVCYNPATNSWEWPVTNGTIIGPRAALAADISGNRVFIFGGRYRHFRVNEMYCLNMATMTWSKNLTDPDKSTPKGRSWHTLTFVSPTRAILYGGFSEVNEVLSDIWMLDVNLVKWFVLKHNVMNARYWHSSVCSNPGEISIVGGQQHNLNDPNWKKNHPNQMLIIHFTPKALLRLCIDSVIGQPDHLQDQWKYLPDHLQKILSQRLEQLNTW